jgi:hypothetical protein
LTPEEYEALKADIARHGLRVPIVVDASSGLIVDGHHRQRALDELRSGGVKVTDYRDVRAFADDEQPAGDQAPGAGLVAATYRRGRRGGCCDRPPGLVRCCGCNT